MQDDDDIFQAVMKADVSAVEAILLDNPNKVNELNVYGQSPLFVASCLGDVAVVRALLETPPKHIIEIDRLDIRGRDAFDAARDFGHMEVFQILEQNFEDDDELVGEFSQSSIVELGVKKINEWYWRVELKLDRYLRFNRKPRMVFTSIGAAVIFGLCGAGIALISLRLSDRSMSDIRREQPIASVDRQSDVDHMGIARRYVDSARNIDVLMAELEPLLTTLEQDNMYISSISIHQTLNIREFGSSVNACSVNANIDDSYIRRVLHRAGGRTPWIDQRARVFEPNLLQNQVIESHTVDRVLEIVDDFCFE